MPPPVVRGDAISHEHYLLHVRHERLRHVHRVTQPMAVGEPRRVLRKISGLREPFLALALGFQKRLRRALPGGDNARAGRRRTGRRGRAGDVEALLVVTGRHQAADATRRFVARDEAFDVVVSADTLVYFGPLEPVVAAAASALRPTGRLVFTVEELDRPGYSLAPSGRYRHAR